MKKPIFLLLVSLLVLGSCSPKLNAVIVNKKPALAYNSEVYVIQIDGKIPKGAKAVGKLSIKDTGFTTKCTYEMVLEQAKLQARQNGANIVKIFEHKTPRALGSTCHRMKVVFYHLKDTSSLAKQYEEPILKDVDYALLYVYRYSGSGVFIGYNLNLGDSTLCRVKNDFKDVIRIKKEGLNVLWAKTESKAEVPIDIIHGKSYFLRCSMKWGVVVGRPRLELIDYRTGKAEYDGFEARNSPEN